MGGPRYLHGHDGGNGVPQDGLDIEQADDLVELLNAEYIARRKGTTN